MRKILSFVLVAVVAAFMGSAAYANYCARDIVPSATLLVPYISVGMTLGAPDAAKATTIFGITNVSREAQIVHVTVWDALSTPQIDFDIVLSGYDVWEINWRDFLLGRFDIFVDGSTTANPYDTHTDDGTAAPNEPFEWGPDGRDTNNALGGGILSTPEDRTVFTEAACDPNPGYGNLSSLSSLIISKLIAPIGAKIHNGCAGNPIRAKYVPLAGAVGTDWLGTLTADPIFFYATADVVLHCSTLFPSDAAYFANIIGHSNVLVGDVTYFNPSGNKSEAMSAVHIESDVDETLGTNFYEIGADHREPLATAFAFRYKVVGGIITRAIVWKSEQDFLANGRVDDCGYYIYYAWDQDEHSKSRSRSGPSGTGTQDNDPNEFPFETQEVPITTANFDVYDATDADGGWFLLVFPKSYDAGFIDMTVPESGIDSAQAWVGVKFDWGTFSGGLEAATLGNANCYPVDVLPQLNTYDGGVAGNGLKGQLQ